MLCAGRNGCYSKRSKTSQGGPDAVRGIYPTVATITAEGFERAGEAEVAERFDAVIATLSGVVVR